MAKAASKHEEVPGEMRESSIPQIENHSSGVA